MMTFLNRVFTKENAISSLRQSSSPFFLQEFGSPILLKTKDRFISLTVIRVMKIMCNKDTQEAGPPRDWFRDNSFNWFVTKSAYFTLAEPTISSA
jgi:hypothetical protein